jgi:hypothetical protein
VSEHRETPEELTRRQWILRLGELVALAGVSGLVPERATALISSEQQSATELPPGLYEPSSKHLMHALSSAEKLHPAIPGSETEYVQPGPAPYRPQFFAAEEFQLVTRLVEVVLGKVDAAALDQTTRWLDLWLHSSACVREAARQLDASHRALAVAFYGETPVRELETVDPQAVARSGIASLEESSKQSYGRGFLQLSEAEQQKLLFTTGQGEQATPLQKFFDLARHEAIRGYYTSAAGIEELDYKGNIYYPDCPGCEIKA